MVQVVICKLKEDTSAYYVAFELINVHQSCSPLYPKSVFVCVLVFDMCVHMCRCLELHPNNLQALMALAVSLTNTGMKQEACEALLGWMGHNPKYKHLLKNRNNQQGSPSSRNLSYSVPMALWGPNKSFFKYVFRKCKMFFELKKKWVKQLFCLHIQHIVR